MGSEVMSWDEYERYEAFVALLAIPEVFDAVRRHTVTQPVDEDQKPLLRLDVMWRGLVSRGLWNDEDDRQSRIHRVR